MATLQSSGAISIANIASVMGGAAPHSLSEYYRGGAYVPSTRTVSTVVREPTSGDYYVNPGNINGRWVNSLGGTNSYYFDGTKGHTSATSLTTGGYTYYRGSYKGYVSGKAGSEYRYGIYRTSGSTTTVNINGSVPTSGAISLSNFYGAAKP